MKAGFLPEVEDFLAGKIFDPWQQIP